MIVKILCKVNKGKYLHNVTPVRDKNQSKNLVI